MKQIRLAALALLALAAVVGQSSETEIGLTEGVGAAASYSGGRLLFISERDGNREIYVMNRDGTNQINLSNWAGSDMWPAWSPTDDRIAFTSERSPAGYELYLVRPDGSDLQALTSFGLDGSQGAMREAWNPGGTKIAFTLEEWCSSSIQAANVALINPDGSGMTYLTNDAPCVGNWHGLPEWSPDGSTIAFTSSGSSLPSPNGTVHLIDADGANMRVLVSMPRSRYPVWSPNGERIAFTFDDDGGGTHLALIDPDGSDFQDLGFGTDPSWSPDGSKIVYSYCQEFVTICTINRDGSSKAVLTDDPDVGEEKPVWSPDGGLIVFESHYSDPVTFEERSRIEVVRPDGSGRTILADTGMDRLTFAKGNDRMQVWEQLGRPVGGIAEYPNVAQGSVDRADSGDGTSRGMYAALVGGLAAAVVALTAGAWYARRRLLG